jgi:hypothetical protein
MKISNRSRGHIDDGLKKGKSEACARQTTFHLAGGDWHPSLPEQTRRISYEKDSVCGNTFIIFDGLRNLAGMGKWF